MRQNPERLFLVSAFFACFLAVFFFAKPSDNTSVPLFRYRLTNGLELVVIPVHKSPIVTQMLWYKVGAADEVSGKTGLAHFFEHLMFKGTAKIPEGQFTRIITENGGNNNAFTTADATVYHQTIAKEHLPTIMALEADRMQGLSITEKAFETEKNVILEERLMRVDNAPRARLSEKMRHQLFDKSPYAQPVIGWEKDIRALTYQDAMDFHQRYYAPNHATLVLAGDITPKLALALAKKYYGSIPPHFAATLAPIFPPIATLPPEKESIALADARVEATEWMRHYVVPSYVSEPSGVLPAALELLAYVLAGSDTGILYQQLVIDTQKASYVGTWYDGLSRDTSIFQLYALPAAGGSVQDVLNAWEEVLQKIAKNGVDEATLHRAKNSFLAEQTYAKDSIHALASFYGEAFVLGATPANITRWETALKNTSNKELKKAATLLLSEAPHISGTLLPATKEPPHAP